MKVSVQRYEELIEARDTLREDVLLQRVRARGPDWRHACSMLLERHRHALYRRCLQRLGDVQDAEDAMQETLLRALLGMSGFEGRSALGTWLFAIADNECNSLARRRTRDQYSEHIRCLIRIHEEHRGIMSTLDGDMERQVRETLLRLPTKAREVLRLRFFADATFEEIALTLGIGLSAAKMRLYRALVLFEARYSDARTKDVHRAEPLELVA